MGPLPPNPAELLGSDAMRSLLVELSGTEEKVEAFIDLVRPYGIRELARTGVIAMARGTQSDAHAAADDD